MGRGVCVTALSTSAIVGFGCAALSALGTNLAFLYKHRGAVAAPDVDMRHPLRSAIDLFRSKWWTIGWLVAVAAFLAHVAALTLLPLSLAQAVLSGGFVLLAVLAERFFGFQLGRRQWLGIVLVAVSLALLGLTGQSSGGDHSDYSAGAYPVDSGCMPVRCDLLIDRRIVDRAEPEEGLEGGHRGAAAVVAEDELVEVDGQVLLGDASMGAVHPGLQVGYRSMHPGSSCSSGAAPVCLRGRCS
jgi:multidrug transporter EmrE-like cation transporter